LSATNNFNSELVNPINTSKNQWICFGLVFIILCSIAILLWFQIEIDRIILFSLNNSNFNNNIVVLNKFFSRYGMPIIVAIYLCYLILSFKNQELKSGRPIFLIIIFSFAVAGISGDILKEIFNRARPIIKYSNEIRCFTNPKTPSFPSGHAVKSVAFVIPFLFYAAYKGGFHFWIKGILAFNALAVCFARIFLGAHYLSDVLAGIGWAFLCLPFSVLLSNRVLKRMSYKKLNIAAKVWIFIYLSLIIYLILM
jgi:membrane-associated phospholipid phosphatase